MLIDEIEPKTGNNDVVADIIDISPVREFNKDGKSGRVATATIQDESGTIKLTLWNEQIDQVSLGERIEIINAWCDEWKEEKKLSTGKYGKIKVLDGNERLTHFAKEKTKKDKEEDLKPDDVVYPEEFLDADENI